ncbi:high-affinity branched-chain amino acid ABC transporter permease LivM [Marinomonas transparens]|uniref:High-affinity branched-chain amino acid ABC transporter permease LivM n=1 Tax=Marinomonas transparens TaxID=2795388 RepID=A0A934JT55_9GAMM|nr:high-affinity branched-chain amino acid ABC transporter permease LivM [Marinomonas transparens]MBJ7537857.1 high-affinity branched-chain amino acid ABC transporter permease LivM [Marinomonas transparens]
MSATAGINYKKSVIDALVAGFMALIVFGPIVGVVLDGYSFNAEFGKVAWMVAVVVIGRFAISCFFQTEKGIAMAFRHANNDEGVAVRLPDHKSKLLWVVPLVIAIGLLVPFIASKYVLTVIILGLIYVLLGLGLNIVVGLAGLLDLGFVGFYAIGAYGLALGYENLGLGFWSMLPIAALIAAMAGAILGFPVLRMHGDYLAIVTLGFGEIIRLILTNWTSLTHGPNGISAPLPTFFGLEFKRRSRDGETFHEFFNIPYDSAYKYMFIYLVLFAVVWAVLFIKHRLVKMPIGRAWEALREDEIACRSLGLNHVLVKLSAFMIGASTAGLAGVFFATYQGFVNPSSFTFFESALILAIVVLGGMGSTLGVVIAAFCLTVLPELLREFAEYRVLMFGILMVVMMIWKPRGIVRVTRTGFAARKGVVK